MRTLLDERAYIRPFTSEAVVFQDAIDGFPLVGIGVVVRWKWWPGGSSFPRWSRMPPVVGLLEQDELAARRQVDGLREETDRIQAELAAAELDWQEWAIARRRVDTVLTPDEGATAETEVTEDSRDAE
jgi:hypothetical protein